MSGTEQDIQGEKVSSAIQSRVAAKADRSAVITELIDRWIAAKNSIARAYIQPKESAATAK